MAKPTGKKRRFVYKVPRMSGKVDIYPETIEQGLTAVNIEGDPAGLRYLARVLEYLADLDLNETDLNAGEFEHIHLHPELQLGRESCEVVVWRADAKAARRM